MEHTSTRDLEDILKRLDELAAYADDTKNFLTSDVRFSDLRKMNDANLAGRLAYYERDYTFELNKKKREEFYREVVRTRIEIRRRVLEQRHAALAAALPANIPGDIIAANDTSNTWRAAA